MPAVNYIQIGTMYHCFHECSTYSILTHWMYFILLLTLQKLSTSASAASKLVRESTGFGETDGADSGIFIHGEQHGEQEQSMSKEEEEEYTGVTPSFLEFVDGLTVKTFKSFPIDTELPPFPEQIDQVDGA